MGRALVATLLLVAACGGVGPGESGADPPPQATVPAAPTSPTPTSPAPTTPEPDSAATVPPQGPLAPDFSLLLSDGETFVLSQEARPVYLVFWAEW